LPKIVNGSTIPVLLADDTSILVKGSNPKDFQNSMVNAFNCVCKCFRTNLLSINVNKTHCIHCKTKNKFSIDVNIVCNNYTITTLPNVKFLDIYKNDSINWSCHVECIIPKLSSACYIM
jgi:hypothetical protein